MEGWYSDSTNYDKLKKAGKVICGTCGSAKIDKALMAPAVRSSSRSDRGPTVSEFVGEQFVEEMIGIVKGTRPDRDIHGTQPSSYEDVERLIEHGVVPIAIETNPHPGQNIIHVGIVGKTKVYDA